MASQVQNRYQPDRISPPGETLEETLDALGMKQKQLAERIGKTPKTINEIIKGKAPITPETALQLERALGIPASFWNHRERRYQEFLARKQEKEFLKREVQWLRNFPLAAMTRLGWIERRRDKIEQMQELLHFFGVASPEQWRLLWQDLVAEFRKSQTYQSRPGVISAWLRQGQIQAQQTDCRDYDKERFRKSLTQIRGLTRETPKVFEPAMKQLCAGAGVAFLLVHDLPGLRVWGATQWLSNKAVIQMTLRYRSDDHFWFTFFHEAGHILNSGKKAVFLDEKKHIFEETEANRFASNFLIPPGDYDTFVRSTRTTGPAIRQFAREIGIAPGIVVGRLQHDRILPFNQLNGLKRRFQWAAQKPGD